MSVDKATVAKIASLARIRMDDAALEQMVRKTGEREVSVTFAGNFSGARPDGTRPVWIEGEPVASSFFSQSLWLLLRLWCIDAGHDPQAAGWLRETL